MCCRASHVTRAISQLWETRRKAWKLCIFEAFFICIVCCSNLQAGTKLLIFGQSWHDNILLANPFNTICPNLKSWLIIRVSDSSTKVRGIAEKFYSMGQFSRISHGVHDSNNCNSQKLKIDRDLTASELQIHVRFAPINISWHSTFKLLALPVFMKHYNFLLIVNIDNFLLGEGCLDLHLA